MACVPVYFLYTPLSCLRVIRFSLNFSVYLSYKSLPCSYEAVSLLVHLYQRLSWPQGLDDLSRFGLQVSLIISFMYVDFTLPVGCL